MSPLLKQYTESQETIGYPDNITTWEFMKMEARNYAKKNSKEKSRINNKQINIIKNKLNALESLSKDELTPTLTREINRLQEIEQDHNYKLIKGHHIRSRLPHFEEGEGDIAFYSKLEKRRGEENLIYSLENEFGEIEEGNENVTKTIFEYYKKLLTKEPENENFQDILLEKVDLRLSEGETEYLNKLISKDKLRKN